MSGSYLQSFHLQYVTTAMKPERREREREREREKFIDNQPVTEDRQVQRREREREKFIDNQEVTEGRLTQRPVGSHRLWALGLQHMTVSTIPSLSRARMRLVLVRNGQRKVLGKAQHCRDAHRAHLHFALHRDRQLAGGGSPT